MKKLLLILSIACLVALGATWHWLATSSEKGFYLKLPRFANPVWSYAFWGESKPDFGSLPDQPNIYFLRDYAIHIHKSQIAPYGTLWCDTFYARQENGKVQFAGLTGSPKAFIGPRRR